MRLLRLELQNWCQHSNLDLVFPDAAIVRLEGQNNVGKTNLIRAIGRVLAQGRSDFGDHTGIRYGANQATIRLTARNGEGTQFVVTRVIKESQAKATLEYEDQVLSKVDDIQEIMDLWFGRQETLLQLFIARQGKIAALLTEKGKERLTKFIEICGFKGFLKKQIDLNKFIKTYPSLGDPTALIQDVDFKIEQTLSSANSKQGQLGLLPCKEEIEKSRDQLQSEKTLFESHSSSLKEKKTQLSQLETGTAKPLPNLKDLQEALQGKEAEIVIVRNCLRHQQALRGRDALEAAQKEFGQVVDDKTDYTSLIQEASQALQQDIEAKNRIVQAERNLEQMRKSLTQLSKRVLQDQTFVKGLPYSTAWHGQDLEVLTKLQTISFQVKGREQIVNHLRAKLQQLEAVKPPSPEVLRACQASEEQLREIQHLRKHAAGAQDSCPLCLHAWSKEEIANRIQALDTQTKELAEAVKKSPQALKVYQAWTTATEEIPNVKKTLEAEETQLESSRLQLNTELQSRQLPVIEIPKINDIIAAYHQVKNALSTPVAELEGLRISLQQEELASVERKKEETEVGARISQANQKLQGILQRQTKAQEQQQKKAGLQKKVEMLQLSLQTLEAGLSERPAEFSAAIEYAKQLVQMETQIGSERDAFGAASNDWSVRFEQMREVEAIKAQLQSLQTALAEKPWTEEKLVQLTKAGSQLGEHRQLNAEITILQEQLAGLKKQRTDLEQSRRLYVEQCRNVSDLEAVSDFLSYDNGPQKFLQSFFRDVLSQTNCLLSEMGLPVSLHMGADLEIIVQEGGIRESSALALGGGYANLIGIAFRIALQRLVLPRVHTVILDEPSTHVDIGNMEILVPFFERLRDKLASHGLEQIIFIDHHPAWKNSSIGVVHVGGENGDGQK